MGSYIFQVYTKVLDKVANLNQGRILVEMLVQVEIHLGEVQCLANGPHGMLGLRM
jgi:hypothetical protein